MGIRKMGSLLLDDIAVTFSCSVESTRQR
jgi:hypothetical protein